MSSLQNVVNFWFWIADVISMGSPVLILDQIKA